MRIPRVLCFLLVSATPWSVRAAWDGPLYAIQDSKIVTSVHCGDYDSLSWGVVGRFHPGLARGQSILAPTVKGAVPVTLGRLNCFLGECNGNYVAVDVAVPVAGNSASLAFPKAFLHAGDMVRAVPEPIHSTVIPGCADPEPVFPDLSLPEVIARRRCDTWPLGTTAEGPFLQVTARSVGVKQENEWRGWNIEHVFVRVIRHHAGTFSSGPWQALDRTSNSLEPLFVVTSVKKPLRILWKGMEGVCCPAKTTLRVSRLTADGDLEFGRSFLSGGQPCD